ncbi:MAG: PilZ domain-containing protein [Candidatus Omnitrophica bacterium]|nr:PilZ domain-containing protein [Candidatus Omnitrophota bacterium]
MVKKTEQRKHPRVETHIPIRYYKLREGAGSQITGSISKNMSQGGIRFRTPEFVSMACRLILELDIPSITKPIKAISKVAWIRKTESGKEYEIGNQFLEMSREDIKLVTEYIDNFLGAKNTENAGRQENDSKKLINVE